MPLEIATFAFHDVTDHPGESGFQRPGARSFTLTPAAFAAHLDAIGAGPCRPSLVYEIDFANPGRRLLLTFDDGGKSALAAAAALERRGWRGHFFVVTSLIGRRTFLDAREIRDLRRRGHVIGNHSHNHPDIFRDLPRERMVAEWREAGDRLAQLLGEPCVVASVPGGDISRTVLESAGSAGVRYLFTSEPWLVPRLAGTTRVLGRYHVKAGATPARVAALARFERWRAALLERRLKGLVRRGLPPLYRAYVRQSTREDATA